MTLKEKEDGFFDGVSDKVAKVKKATVNTYDVAVEKTCKVGKDIDGYVHENPWKSVGIAAGVGLLIGLLLRPKKK